MFHKLMNPLKVISKLKTSKLLIQWQYQNFLRKRFLIFGSFEKLLQNKVEKTVLLWDINCRSHMHPG